LHEDFADQGDNIIGPRPRTLSGLTPEADWPASISTFGNVRLAGYRFSNFEGLVTAVPNHIAMAVTRIVRRDQMNLLRQTVKKRQAPPTPVMRP
jgi:hypothetical protein